MARIRHLAICTDRQEVLATFYRDTFGLAEVFRHKGESGKTAIYLSDGEINLAFIPARTKVEGLDHFGFQVESVQATADNALANGAISGAKAVPRDGRQNEAFITDPIGQRVDLSSAGWHLGGGGSGRIQHLAIKADDPPALAQFYTSTFGMFEVFRRNWERGAVYLSDGHVNLALLPNNNHEDDREPADLRGINHLGIRIDDLDVAMTTAYANGAKPSNRELPRDGRFAETFVFDPVGQRIDLSQQGWKLQP
jgi:catechol 2,3-dioxygenase-like lactoylglutathione lyase family enzyme